MCGIFGHISLEKKKRFNFPMFCTLGINNDSRGGDSCGIFIDGKSEYGTTKDTVNFEDFFLGSELLDETKEFNIALGHCRKASPGMGISPEKAQPVILKNNKTGEVRFVMIHNGTIYNHEELAKKYIPNIDITGLTDSQVMARIFFYKGYDCLSEYQGGSVFFIVDYRQPEPLVLMFKGASRKYDTKAAEEVDERPLFISLGKEDLVFSSISTYLPAFRPGIDIGTVKPNHLIKYSGNKLEIVKEYSRKSCCQAKPITTTSYRHTPYVSEYSPITRTYLQFDEKENLYEAEKKPVHGKQFVSKYGMISNKLTPETREMYFWRGVLLKSKECFKLLEEYQKKTKQNDKDFFKKNQNFIRFLSMDKLWFKNGSIVTSTGIYTYQLYSGVMRNYFSSYRFHFSKGIFMERRFEYNPGARDFDFLEVKDNLDVSKLKRKLC